MSLTKSPWCIIKCKKELRPSSRIKKQHFKISLNRATFEQTHTLENFDLEATKMGIKCLRLRG